MADVVMVMWDGGGTVGPMLGLAAALLARGHGVRVIGPPSVATRTVAAGASFRPFRRAQHPSPHLAVEDELGAYLELFVGRGIGEDLDDELDREPADAVVLDCMLATAFSFAERRAVRTAALVHLPYQWAATEWMGGWTFAFGPLNGIRRELGLDPLDDGRTLWSEVWGRTDLTLVATLESFDRRHAEIPPRNVRYVGPIREPAPPEAADLPKGGPLVLVGLSTSYMHQEDALTSIAAAFDGVGATALMTTGCHIAPPTGVPANVHVREWIAHEHVLPQAALVITHAGHGTTMAALGAGVPLLCMPMGRDQHAIAQRVEELGAGRQLPPEASPEAIRNEIEVLLGDSSYRESAQAIAAELAALPVDLAVTTFEQTLR